MPDVATAVIRPRTGHAGRCDVHRARAAGPLRLLCPRGNGNAAWIVASSLGGGLVDGDRVALEVDIDSGATGVITTQASTKVYKGTSSQRLDVRVRGDGTALVVPDPIVPYRDARYTQEVRIALDPDASLVSCDTVTAGRLAYDRGERWALGRFDSTLAIEIGGKRWLFDRLLFDRDRDRGEIVSRMGRFVAMSTVVMVGPRVVELAAAELAALPPVDKRPPALAIAGSAREGGAMFRIAGDDIETVVRATRALLFAACKRCGEIPWARKW